MLDKISKYIIDNILLIDETKTDNEYREVLLFGIRRILEDIPKFIFILILCTLLNILTELIVILMVTLIYKTFIGGAHAKTNLGCFLISTIYFILPTMLQRYNVFSKETLLIIYIFTNILSIYIIKSKAPADTEEIPIINKEKRKILKKTAYLSLLILNIIIYIFRTNLKYVEIIIYTVLLINLFATKIAYKFLRCKYGHESKEYGHLYSN